MSLGKNKKSLALMALLALVTLMILGSIYWIRPQGNSLFEGVRQRKAGTDLVKRSRLLGEDLFLIRESRLAFKQSRLVFRGIKEGKILIDLYLLELDPDTPYHHLIPASRVGEEIRLGPNRFCLVSADRTRVRLKARGR